MLALERMNDTMTVACGENGLKAHAIQFEKNGHLLDDTHG